MMCTIMIEGNDLTFNNNRWDATDTKQIIQQNLLEYAKIVWNVAHKDADRATTYDDAMGNHDQVRGVKELLYHIDGTYNMLWHIRTPNVSLVNHVQSVYGLQYVLILSGAPKKASYTLIVGSMMTLCGYLAL